MAEFLVLTLSASLGAMGDLAGHERRPGLTWPGKSALLGLVGAAMGLRRDDPGWNGLSEISVAVGSMDEGRPLRDYHTIESVPSAKVKAPDSRPDALRRAGWGSETSITVRDYRNDPLFAVALWNGPLDAIAQAFRTPVFHLYFGRKSCPLSAPVDTRVVQADGPVTALRQASLPCFRTQNVLSGVMFDSQPVLSRIMSDPHPTLSGTTEMRNDVMVDRQHWHFTSRGVVVMAVGEGTR